MKEEKAQNGAFFFDPGRQKGHGRDHRSRTDLMSGLK